MQVARRVAVGQLCAGSSVDANLAVCRDLIARAAALGSSMVFLPEASDYISASKEEAVALAQPLDGPFLTGIQDAAKQHGVWVAVGMHERAPPSDTDTRFYNAHVLVRDDGVVVDVYHKVVRMRVTTQSVRSSPTSSSCGATASV